MTFLISAHLGGPNRGGTMTNLSAEQLARVIVQSIDRHGLRGLIYEADGTGEVVMHGKVDMTAVARDVLTALAGDQR